MASDDKKTKTSPAPKNEAAVKKEAAAKKKKKDECQPKNKITSDADLSKAEGSEKDSDSPLGYSRGEGQKPVSKALERDLREKEETIIGCRGPHFDLGHVLGSAKHHRITLPFAS